MAGVDGSHSHRYSLFKMMKFCPCCNLPLDSVGSTLADRVDGQHFVVLICARCARRVEKIPKSAKWRLLRMCAKRVARTPARYAHRVFQSAADACLAVAVAQHVELGRDTVSMILESSDAG
jgi:hypothetical protein